MRDKHRKLTRKAERELRGYVNEYTARGVVGVWWPLARAIESALAELDNRRLAMRAPIPDALPAMKAARDRARARRSVLTLEANKAHDDVTDWNTRIERAERRRRKRAR